MNINMEKYPFMTKLSGLAWLLISFVFVFVIFDLLLGKFDENKSPWGILLMLCVSAWFFVPGYGIIRNKMKNIGGFSWSFILISVWIIYANSYIIYNNGFIVSGDLFYIWLFVFLTGVFSLMGQSKYKNYINEKTILKKESL